jgi:hypothetical protein
MLTHHDPPLKAALTRSLPDGDRVNHWKIAKVNFYPMNEKIIFDRISGFIIICDICEICG